MKTAAWISVVLGAALLALLFVLFRPAAETATPAATPAAPKLFQLTVKGGRLESGPATLRVVEGDEVVLRITADRADELHLHGYDLALALKAGEAAELRFVARRTGRFEYELHHSHAELGALEVHPK